MLRFISVPQNLRDVRDTTITIPRSAIFPSLERARAEGRSGSVLVYDASQIPDSAADPVKLHIPDARNGVPYRMPVPVVAAGGYVVRDTSRGRDLLLIFRRGVWDLPKGKAGPGESTEETALREVAEEVGATGLRIVASLGTTTHGYPDGLRYLVKTTYWFLMTTTSESFSPQEVEQIEDVKWFPWEEAREMLAFQTLRDHMASIRL